MTINTMPESVHSELATEVTLTFPAAPCHVRLARLVASGMATQAGFGIDDIEDLRIGVDEMCSLLVDYVATDSAGLEDDVILRFRLDDGGLSVLAQVPRGIPHRTFAPDELSLLILDAVVEDRRMDVTNSEVKVSFRKPLSATPL